MDSPKKRTSEKSEEMAIFENSVSFVKSMGSLKSAASKGSLKPGESATPRESKKSVEFRESVKVINPRESRKSDQSRKSDKSVKSRKSVKSEKPIRSKKSVKRTDSIKSEESTEKIIPVPENEKRKRKKRLPNEQLDYMADSESGDSIISTQELKKETWSPIKKEPDFFDLFGDVPDISEISLDISAEALIECKSITQIVEAKDIQTEVEQFANAEEEALPDEEEEKLEKAKEAEVAEEEEPEYKKLPVFLEDDDLLRFVEKKDKAEMEYGAPEKKLIQEADKMLETFLEKEDTSKPRVDPAEQEAAERRELERQLRNMVREAVNEIVGKIDFGERIKPINAVLQDLDKYKIMEFLLKQLEKRKAEKIVNNLLHRRIALFYRRKRELRPFREQKPAEAKISRVKYSQALTKLSRVRDLFKKSTNMSAKSIQIATNQLEELQTRERTALAGFEELIKKTLKYERNEKLKEEVEQLLSKMARMRKFISAKRKQLLLKLHKAADIKRKMANLRNFGHGLKMKDYERLRTELEMMEQRCEEETAALNKQRSEYKEQLEIISNLEQKLEMAIVTENLYNKAHDHFTQEQDDVHEYVVYLKLYRDEIRREVKEMSFQSGLLDKPALMVDYDVSLANCKESRERAKQHEKDYRELIQQVEEAEEELENVVEQNE